MENRNIDRFRVPGTLLIVYGSLNGGIGLLTLIGGILRLVLNIEEIPTGEAERIGYLTATVVGYGVALLSVAVSPIIVYGGTRLLAGARTGIVKAAAFLSLLPIANCCLVLGIPVAIWALAAIYKKE